jgi:hypothetical protein
MSHPQFSGGPRGMLIELDKNTSNLWGGGNAGYPCLGWQLPLIISFHQKTEARYAFRMGEAQLRLNGTKIADAQPLMINRILHHSDGKVNECLNLDFPVNSQQIAALERARNGGEVKLDLWIKLHYEELRPARILGAEVWELTTLAFTQLQQAIVISQSDWVAHVLSGVGYGKVHVVEFPAVSLEACAALDHSFKSLKQAEEKHRLGFYDDAVGKCRMALDKFFDYVSVDPNHPESRKIPVLKSSWETKLGKATYAWLNSTLGAIKSAGNPAHHVPDAHYDQLESQMIIAITTAVVAYVARADLHDDATT